MPVADPAGIVCEIRPPLRVFSLVACHILELRHRASERDGIERHQRQCSMPVRQAVSIWAGDLRCFDSLGDPNFMEELLIVIWTIRCIGCWNVAG